MSVAKHHPPLRANQNQSSWWTIIIAGLLVASFFGIVSWFANADIYHTQFFHPGAHLILYHFFRLSFAGFFIWLIYVMGYGVLTVSIPLATRQMFSPAERLVFGFAIGLGVAHVGLFILGIFNLYYRALMLAMAVLILSLSANHFKQVMVGARFALQSRWREMSLIHWMMVGLIGTALAWLLLVRGLYPGGGGDYFTHYFYYYLSVIQHHGLMPNDVWYHYYYSKGAGLYFFGMLLTDPEAPQLITFCCVTIAAVALATLTSRLAPRSLWPVFCTVLYLLYNLIALKSDGGGEFQKSHEETTALMLILMWSLCLYSMRPKQWEKITFITSAALLIAAAILTQATAVFLGVLFGVFAGIALCKQNLRQMTYYGLLAMLAGVAVMSILLLNYFVTGLATDQALNLTWRYANLTKLNAWGVLPNVILVAWIRDNYSFLTLSWSWEAIKQLLTFMRIDVLWVAVVSGMLALFSYGLMLRLQPRKLVNHDIQLALVKILIAIITFAILSLLLGREQPVSYYRFSSFFAPLLILLITLAWALVLHAATFQTASRAWLLQLALPLVLLVAVLFSWPHWFNQVKPITQAALRLLIGKYSLGDAYTHQPQGYAYGGIHPGALMASRHVPKGARIWSTSVDTYCMAPDCQIESVISFKLSSHLDKILQASPEVAKQQLQAEGLHYFLFSMNSRLLDILPYSPLFDPKVISQYFGVQWTDGETYLLTWRGPGIAPLDQRFLKAYHHQLQQPENNWFMFSQAVAQVVATMKLIEQSSYQQVPDFSWRANGVKGIEVLQATYGYSCLAFKVRAVYANTVQSGNATYLVRQLCNGKQSCEFQVDKRFGDPANGCAKDFSVVYRCDGLSVKKRVEVEKEAFGKAVLLDCNKDKGG